MNDMEAEPIRSGRYFNKYKIGYSRIYNEEGDQQMLDHILIETMLTYKPFPCEIRPVSNYVTMFLEKEQLMSLIEQYNLQPFNMNIQSIDRTFVDKLFAICDYHEDKDYARNSRHIYDIHMVYRSGYLNVEGLPSLIEQVIDARRMGKKTYSSRTGYKLVHTLQEIIGNAVYRQDYETNTREFLSEYIIFISIKNNRYNSLPNM